jgi:hypothetical protein
MNFTSGDQVKFLNDVGGGIIQSVDNKIAQVLMDDGFEVPVLVSELILVKKASEGSFIEKNEVITESDRDEEYSSVEEEGADNRHPFHEKTEFEPPKETGQNPAFSVYYAIVPTKESNSEQFDFYLINDSEFHLSFNLMLKEEEFFRSLKTGSLEAETKIYVRSFIRQEINAFPEMKFQCLFLRKGLFQSWSPVNRNIVPDPQDLFAMDGFSENDFFEENAYIGNIFEKPKWPEQCIVDKDRVSITLKEKGDLATPAQTDRPKDPEIEEVDLHIHELVEDHSGMSNSEIIQIQLARFTTALEGAMRGKVKKIVFIHGVGNGKLKFELRRELDKNYPRLKYQDASFKEYGFGATMVILRK